MSALMTTFKAALLSICCSACNLSAQNSNYLQQSATRESQKIEIPLDCKQEIPNIFCSKEELNDWAQNSSFGGGYTLTLQTESTEILIADRSFTSGTFSSKTSVYKKDSGRYILALTIPQKPVFRTYEIRANRLFVTEKESSGKKSHFYFVVSQP